MVKCDHGIVELKGAVTEILADATCMLKALKHFLNMKDSKNANFLYLDVIRTAEIDDEDIKEQVEEQRETIDDMLSEFLKDALSEEEEEEDE